MKRRLFLKASAATALVPAALNAPARAATNIAQDKNGPNQFFYDARFAEARAAAMRAPAATPVTGDVTQVWTQGLNRLSQTRALALSGVTTESFYFCLKTLLQSHAQLDARIERVSADLYAWSIRSILIQKTG